MKYKPQNKEQLKKLVNDQSIYLGDIDTSLITDMSYLFEESKREDFSGIKNWDVSNVKTMRGMFSDVKNFNHPLNLWDVSSVEDMGGMFYASKSFNQDISSWDVSSLQDMTNMFLGAKSLKHKIDWQKDTTIFG